MDLSSLEGPPIQGSSRFTIPSWPGSPTAGTPSIDTIFSPTTEPIDLSGLLPPRPASTNDLPARSRSSWHGCPRLDVPVPPSQRNTPTSSRSINLGSSGSPAERPRYRNDDYDNLPAHFKRARIPSPIPASWYSHSVGQGGECSYRNSNASDHANGDGDALSHTHSSQRLVWLDQENIWVLISSASAPSSPSNTPQSWIGSAPDTAAAAQIYAHPQPQRQTLSPYAPRGPLAAPVTPFPARTIPLDAPPPYERHIYDRPLPPLPVGEEDSGSEGERVGEGPGVRSRWTAVARRMNRG